MRNKALKAENRKHQMQVERINNTSKRMDRRKV